MRVDRRPRDPFRLRPSELLVIIVFWSCLAALTVTGRLLDPRIAEVNEDLRTALISLALVEYSTWAILTVPVVWLVGRLSGSKMQPGGLLALVAVGVIVAVGVNIFIATVRVHVLPLPSGRPGADRSAISPYELVGDLIVYFAVLGAALARNYFIESQARSDEAKQLRAEAAELRAQLVEAQLAVLQTQLNPHFLFNTLNAISSLVERDPRGVRRMIARLSELLRHTLEHTNDQEQTLEREVELLRWYLDIMEVRFKGRLEVAVTVDDELRAALVPSLILQPLVENALMHGAAAIDKLGKIEVRATRSHDGTSVLLSVRDNGPGPAATSSSGPYPPGDHGVGLRNTTQRLIRLYGERQRFSLRNAGGGGTIAEVTLPFHVAARH